jgi:hypothetical protein
MPRGARLDLHLFFLGCGFMLLETKSITTLALLVGMTWKVNAVAICSILIVILIANALVSSGRAPSPRVAYACLFVALAVSYVLSLDPLLETGLAVRTISGGAFVALPIFFASVVFSSSFARAENLGAALGSNLLGAVLGGVIEYTSTLFGLKVLYLAALAIYAASALARRRS